MATAVNTFNTGLAAGTTITAANSGGTAGDAFDGVFGTSGLRTYEVRGSGLYGKFGAGATSAQSYAEYSTKVGSTAVDTGQVHGSMDVLLDALPVGNTARIALVTTAADAFVAQWHVTTAGKVEQWTGAGSVAGTSINSVTAGQWFKLHISVLKISATTGQLRTRLFLDPDSIFPTETLLSTATLNLGSTAGGKYRVGLLRPFTNFHVGIDNVRWSTDSELPIGAGVVNGPIVGAMYSDGFAVSLKTDAPAGQAHRLVVSTSAALTSPTFGTSVTANSDGWVMSQVTGLAPNTTYYYGWEVNGSVLPAPAGRGQVLTDPTPGTPASGSFAFGSCQWDVTTAVTFDKIHAYTGPHGPVRRFIHMGDLHYLDATGATPRSAILAAVEQSVGRAQMRALLANKPTTYAPDNHDYGGPNSDRFFAGRAFVAGITRNVFPSYAMPASDGVGWWYTYVWGRIRFIQLDVRSQRDPYNDPNTPTKTLLGTEQKAWLKTLLTGPEPLKVIQGNIYWRSDSLTGDRWGSYPDEFDELSDFINNSPDAFGKVLLLFGDRHALAGDNGTSANTRGMPQVGGAPFQQGSTAPGEAWSAGYYHDDPNTIQAFGILDVTDDGTDITVVYKGYTSLDDTVRVTMTSTFGPTYDWAQFPEPPALPDQSDLAQTYNLGLRFDLAADTPIVGVRWRVPNSAPGIDPVFALWDADTFARLRSVTVDRTTLPLGQEHVAHFPTPFPGLAAGNYIASVFTDRYTATTNYAWPATSLGGTVTAPDGENGRLAVTTNPLDFPGSISGNEATYHISPVVELAEGAPAQAITGAGGIATDAGVGTPTLTPGAVTVAPGGVASGAGVGTPTVAPGAVAVAPAGVPTGASVGTPTVTQAGPAGQTVAPPGIPTMNKVGSPTLTGGDLAQIVAPVGIPSAAAAGRPMVTRMGADREMAPCAWEVIVACGDDYASFPAELRSRAEMWATEMLWMLSGRRFGTCPVTVRPCQDCSELSYQTFGVVLDGGNGSWVPYLYDGNWSNCGCAGRHSCRPAEEVWLPGPVAGITEVRVDGVLVPASAYRVDDGNWLVRHDGSSWPRVQDLNKPAGQAGTWTVTYLRGTPVPTGGKIAAGALAYEFAKACIGGPCRLPQQVQSIVRAGVEMQLVSEDAAEMLTGVSETDQWLRAVNPSKLRQRPRVASLDLNLPRIQTWG